MSIVSSEVVSQGAQSDGSILIHERHTDHLGVAYDFQRYVPSGTDTGAFVTGQAATVESQLQAGDLRRCVLDEPWDYVLKHAQESDLGSYARELYRNASKETLARVAKRIQEWITNGRFTENQVRNAFGLTPAQWDTLKQKMLALIAAYDAVESAEGE